VWGLGELGRGANFAKGALTSWSPARIKIRGGLKSEKRKCMWRSITSV